MSASAMQGGHKNYNNGNNKKELSNAGKWLTML